MSKPTKAQNPDMDFGFYATFPRIVRTGYKEVSAVQKWLYVCLKDLAGDDGTCYRTIRALVEETGLSAGMISESILVLHKAGLIHAEKKKRSTGGKEVWHISIVDIWKKNGEAHPTKRSPAEQTVPYIDVQSANVHHMNDNPKECSAGEHSCSPYEQECSLSETEVITITRPVSKNNIEARTEGTYRAGESENAAALGASAPTPAPSSSQGNLTLENTDYQPEPAIPGHDLHAPHLAESCRNWRLMYGGLDAATCQQYQAAIDSLVSPAYQTLQNENDNHSRIASDTPTEEQDGPDGHSNSFSRDHSGSNHHSGGDRQQPAARDTRRTTLTERVAQGALNSQENGDADDLATHPSTSPAGNHRDVGAEQAAALGAQKDVGGQAVGGYRTAEQATLTAGTTRQSAHQAPAYSNAPLFASTRPARPALTEEGKQVRDWYQVIRACRVRLTNENINACNGLAEEDGISFESLKEAIEHWEKDGFVKKREIPIDLIQLENPKGSFTFAKAMLVIRGRKKPVTNVPKPATPAEIEENPYSLAAQLARNPLPTLGATV